MPITTTQTVTLLFVVKVTASKVRYVYERDVGFGAGAVIFQVQLLVKMLSLRRML